jgi:hypothetical protein
MELVYLTPPVAMQHLAQSDVNRKLSRNRAAHFAAAFRRGEHRLTGDAIEFNGRQLMTNGQHRELSVVIADIKADEESPDGRRYTDVYPNYPVIDGYIGLPFWIMHNAPNDETLVRDTGRPRNFIDHLRMLEVPNASYTAQVARLRYQYERGVLIDQKKWQGRLAPTNMELMSFFDRPGNREEIVDGVRAADRVRRHVRLSVPSLSVAWIVLQSISAEDVEAFFAELRLDQPMAPAVSALVKSTHTQRRSGRGQTGWASTWDARHQLALIFKTWNHYREGTAPKLLHFKSGGAKPEEFPVPQ